MRPGSPCTVISKLVLLSFFHSVGNLESMIHLWEAREHILSGELSRRISKQVFLNINIDVCKERRQVKTEKPFTE